ncbi:MAG: PLDc N-terminal domain-containing protein [bacterium]
MKKAITAGLMALSALAFPVAVHAQDYGFTTSYDSTFSLSSADSAAAAGLFGAVTILPLVCLCLYFVVDLIIAIVIYNNAKKNNVENPALWLVLALLLSWIGWLLYAFVGKKKTASAHVSEAPKATGPVAPQA